MFEAEGKTIRTLPCQIFAIFVSCTAILVEAKGGAVPAIKSNSRESIPVCTLVVMILTEAVLDSQLWECFESNSLFTTVVGISAEAVASCMTLPEEVKAMLFTVGCDSSGGSQKH